MGCNCNNDDNAIQVYVELTGRENYHSSLRGRDEEDQHPISSITNLEDKLDEIDEKINTTEQTIQALDEDKEAKINNLANVINNVESTLNEQLSSINSKIDEIDEKIDNISFDDYYTKTEIDTKTYNHMKYKGQVTTKDDLPIINDYGDCYNVVKTGANYVWNGTGWDDLSPAICLKKYATKEYVDGTLNATVQLIEEHLKDHYYDKQEIDELIAELDPTDIRDALIYRGTVANKDQLPITDKIGDTYSTVDTGIVYFWNGSAWQALGGNDDTYTKEEIEDILYTKADIEDVEELQTKVSANGEAIEELEEITQWKRISDVI